MGKRKRTPQDKELGRTPSEREGYVHSFDEGYPNPFADIPAGEHSEKYPHEPGFAPPDPRMLVRDPNAQGPKVTRGHEQKNERRAPETGYGDDEHQLGEEIREQRKAG